MKLSLIAVASLALLAAACGSTEEEPGRPAPPSSEGAPVEEPNAPPPRQLVTGRQLSTSPVNLLTDPGFALVDQQTGFGSFLAFYDGTFQPFQLATKMDSQSPAGFGGAVAIVKAAGATDKKSDGVMLLTSFLGGAGPFHARLWVSKSDVKGKPVDLPTDGSAVTASIADGDPDRGESFDLAPVSGSARTVGGRTWVLYAVDVAKPLAHGGFFLVRTGEKGGQIHLAAPEVTTDQIAVGQPVLAGPLRFAAKGRPKRASERAAIIKYRSIPPRLVPASAQPSRPL